jgi:hypothetical protein
MTPDSVSEWQAMNGDSCLFDLTDGGCQTCDQLRGLFWDVNRCKASGGQRAGTRAICDSLRFRTQYFEPNPATLGHWRDVHGFYKPDIDRRVLFVCESPKKQRERPELDNDRCYSTRGFTWESGSGTISGFRTWDRVNPRAEVFLAARTPRRQSFTNYAFESSEYHGLFGDLGLQNCLITNVVLCASVDGPKPRAFVQHCAGEFLTRTLDLVKPIEVVVLGGDAAKWYGEYRTVHSAAPVAREIFHYSVRPKDAPSRLASWRACAADLKRSLPADPAWFHAS